MSSQHTPPTVDPHASARWHGLPIKESPWLHEEVGRRMQERLEWIKHQPASWVHWEPWRGGWQTHAALMARYPHAACTLIEGSKVTAQQVRQALHAPWWQPKRWLQSQPKLASAVDSPAHMLWSNMALHMSADPQGLIAQWHQALAVDGFLMFSCLGPDTLGELRSVYADKRWPPASHAFTDMHDWGDMLVAAGFADLVMDMERITLSFSTPERLLQELRELGRNLHPDRFTGLRGRRWRQQLLDALSDKPLQLTFEVIYGHAVKPAPRLTVAPHSAISLADMRQALARGRETAANRPAVLSGREFVHD